MHDAVAQELRIFEARDHGENALLFPEFQIRLEADEVVHGAFRRFLAQLERGPGAVAGARVGEADRLHGAESDGVVAALGHDFDGHAAFIDAGRLEVVELRGLGGDEGFVEGLVLLLVHGAVDVVVFAAHVVAGLGEGFRHIDGVA